MLLVRLVSDTRCVVNEDIRHCDYTVLAELRESFHFVIPVLRQLSGPLLSVNFKLHQRGSFLRKLVERECEE